MKPRARQLGIPFPGNPGVLNAITDVPGVEVGHTTLIQGEGKLIIGKGPVRTGVSAILPHGKVYEPVMAGWTSLNGSGEMTGTTWIEESGFLYGPVLLTNTQSIGAVHQAASEWQYQHGLYDPGQEAVAFLPVVAETCDGFLNDLLGYHVQQGHVFSALDQAAGGPVAEGNVGGGTGMRCYEFKGGIGTASRKVTVQDNEFHVGVLVQANHGKRENLLVAGIPVGKEIHDLMPECVAQGPAAQGSSIIGIAATDAPLLPHQLKRLARRIPLGLARTGGIAANGSGDIFLAFSTSNLGAANANKPAILVMMPNEWMDSLMEAVIQATEEAIINALVAAGTMSGINGNKLFALPHDRLYTTLKKYNRLQGA